MFEISSVGSLRELHAAASISAVLDLPVRDAPSGNTKRRAVVPF
jgi:hypothetical protein